MKRSQLTKQWGLAVGVVVLALLLSTGVQAAGKTLTWVGCGISKKAFMAEIAQAYEKKTGIKIVLQGGGATKGIRKVALREVDIGGSCRDLIYQPQMMSPIDKERYVTMHPVAWDALVVIVHKDNPVTDITLEQIRGLYKGKIRNWKELGGKDAPIKVYARKGKISGVGRSIRELVFSNYDEEFVVNETVPSSGPLEKAIVKEPNSIGITGYSSAKRRKVKMLHVEGIEPSYEKIKAGGYMLYRPLYLVTPMGLHVSQEVNDFIAFIRSDEGKSILRKAGTVPYEDAIPTWLKYLSKRQVATGGIPTSE